MAFEGVKYRYEVGPVTKGLTVPINAVLVGMRFDHIPR